MLLQTAGLFVNLSLQAVNLSFVKGIVFIWHKLSFNLKYPVVVATFEPLRWMGH